MGTQIDAMAVASSLTGAELMFASQSSTPKSVTPTVVKEFVVDEIEAITPAGSVATGNDLMAIQSGALVPVDIDLVTQRAIDIIWAKAAVVTPAGSDTLPFSDGGVEKTVTMTVLAEAVRGIIEATVLDVSDLSDGAGGIATTDYMLVTQGSTAKRIQISDLSTLIYASLAAHVTGKSAISTPVDADELYVVRGGTAYKITLAQIATHAVASAAVTGSGTTDFLTQWASSTVLQAGPSVLLSSTGFNGPGSDTALPTTAAVRGEMDTIVVDATDIGAALAGTDEFLVYDLSGTAQKKSALSRLWTYILALIVAVTDVSSYGWVLDEDTLTSDDATKVPTQQSVKAYVDAISADLPTTAGVGITGTADSFASSVEKHGTLFKTTIVVDIDGLSGGGTANDIIGADGAGVAHLGQITAAANGTIFAGSMTCLELPTGGDPDIDLYSAVEATGVEDTLVTDLTETILLNSGDLVAGTVLPLTAFPAANEYLYLANGTFTDATYTAGIVLIELWGK